MSESDQDTPVSILSYAIDQSVNAANGAAVETEELTQSKPHEIIASKSILKKSIEIAADAKAVPKFYKSMNVAHHNQPQVAHVARATTAKQQNYLPSVQPVTHPLVGAVGRAPSRERLPKKTVAFGLTTNLDDTVEKLQHRLSVLRPQGLCAVSMKNTEEVQKALKAYADEVSALRADKEQLQKTNEELREELSNLRAIVVEISSRVMRLENGTADKSSPLPAPDGSADAGDSRPSRVVRNSPARSPPLPSTVHNRSVSAGKPVVQPAANGGRQAIETVGSQQHNGSFLSVTIAPQSPESATLAVNHFVGSSQPCDSQRAVPSHVSIRSEVGQVLALIENRLRETPEILGEVWKLIERTKKPTRSTSARKPDNRQLNDARLPGANQTGSPYSARYTQKMTVERTYSIQADLPCEKFDPNARRGYAPSKSNGGGTRRPIVTYRDSTADDAQFFKNEQYYDRQRSSEERFFRGNITAGDNDDYNYDDEDGCDRYEVHNRTASTFGQRAASNVADVRERYRRRKC